MSFITSVVVYGARHEAMEGVNAWLHENDTERHQQFMPLDAEVAGGSKFFTDSVYAAAFNYMPCDLLDKLRDPRTWTGCVLSVKVIVDGESGEEVFMFGYVKDTKAPVCRGVSTYDYDFDIA